jgi:ABC-type multidrug transport system ATPase subunit
MISLQDVRVELDEKKVLTSIDFNWNPGESIALIGANGAGKSTLLKVLATMLKPSSGKMVYSEGTDLRQWRSSRAIFFGKFLGNLMVVLLVALISVPAFFLFF